MIMRQSFKKTDRKVLGHEIFFIFFFLKFDIANMVYHCAITFYFLLQFQHPSFSYRYRYNEYVRFTLYMALNIPLSGEPNMW